MPAVSQTRQLAVIGHLPTRLAITSAQVNSAGRCARAQRIVRSGAHPTQLPAAGARELLVARWRSRCLHAHLEDRLIRAGRIWTG